MADDFINNFRNDFGNEEGPDWIQDLAGDDGDMAEPAAGESDDFDRLRQQSARASSASGGMTLEEERSSGGGFSLNQFTPGQRMILAILVLLNVIVGGVAILALTGIIG